MKKWIALLMAALMLVTMLVGCGQKEAAPEKKEEAPAAEEKVEEVKTEEPAEETAEDDKLYIAASHGYGAVQHWQIKTVGMEDAAAKYGVEFIYKYADGNLQQEVADIENFVEMGVDYVIVGPCNSEGIVPTIEDRLLTLSTCSYDYEDARYILVASMTELDRPE